MLKLAAMSAAVVCWSTAVAAQTMPIKVGVLTDMSGPYAAIAGKGAVVAAELAIADFAKEFPAVKVELVSADHQNKPDVAISIARKWFDSDGVSMVSELTTSAIALAVQKLAEDKDKVSIVSGAGSSDLTGKACSKTGFHWTYDTYALARGTGSAIVDQGAKQWFFLTVDYAFGKSLQQDVTDAVLAKGGSVIGDVKHPLNTSDFSSFLLQAQASKADVIGLANAGSDLINVIKQANEFGIAKSQRLAALLVYISDVHALGLNVAKNVYLTTAFYWDMNDETRAWSQRYFDKVGAMPTMAQAGEYSAVLHYLRATQKAGSTAGGKVAEAMRALPVKDIFAPNGTVRADGRMVHDMYLARVKEPSQSTKPWDYYAIVKTIKGDEAFRKMAAGNCPLVSN
ncbi:ABC transporter substrate-binding protein [Tardiphaga alba]|uniref:ABC transporter substrate-binding protein n=1 Tax=Tardiphaga alba TaxID=340268 RepID=A0ABX8A5T8_9BRAD|nr:ABC transporter substrate-binding protein [Tardiphaga alba]QUS38646.1 ABC transporter substrate-binding protein [Tardiphaga alba]